MTIKIKLLKPTEYESWDNYVHNHPNGTLFHLTSWKTVIEKTYHHKAHYLMAVSEDRGQRSEIRDQDINNSKLKIKNSTNPVPNNSKLKIQNSKLLKGVLPIFSIKSLLFGRSMVSVPFAPYGSILADDDSTKNALYEKAVSLTQAENHDYLEMRQEKQTHTDLPTKDLYYVFKKTISDDNDENLKAIPRKARRMVRQGIKHRLETILGHSELLDRFYRLFATSYRNLGTPVFSKRYLKTLLDTFNQSASILIISKNGLDLSGVMSFYFKDQVIPYYSGANPESHKFAANDYLYWMLMCHAAENGYTVFDFGRSKKDTGPYHFKRHWGFSPEPLPYQYYLNRIKEIPNISPTNPKYQKKIELWKKMPIWATKIIGPRIAKHLC